jgi:hypothetical protein
MEKCKERKIIREKIAEGKEEESWSDRIEQIKRMVRWKERGNKIDKRKSDGKKKSKKSGRK